MHLKRPSSKVNTTVRRDDSCLPRESEGVNEAVQPEGQEYTREVTLS